MSSNVLIYSNNIFVASETFIRNPPLKFQRYTPYFVGSLRLDELPVDESIVFTANGRGLRGRIQQQLWLNAARNLGVHRLASRLKKLNPVLLQAHFGTSAVYALDLVERLKIPLITYYHGIAATTRDEAFAKSRYARPYLQRRQELIEKTTLFLTQSNFLRDRIITQGFPEERIRTHYVGIEIDESQPLIPLENREPYVLFLARLSKMKGCKYAIEAMAQVQGKYPQIKFVIAGDGPARERLEKQAQDMLANYEFVGWQTPEQVNNWMRKAMIFCVPSVTAPSGVSEGFGMVFIEAQRWGTPVASFAHGGIVESVADGETGLLAPEGDSTTLTQNLLRLIEDSDLWTRFSQQGYERVRDQFEVKKLAHQLESIYDSVLEQKLAH